MSLLDDLRRADTTDCKLCFYISTLNMDQRAEWSNTMRLPVETVPNMNVVRYLRPRGVQITEASVRRHRKNHVSA